MNNGESIDVQKILSYFLDPDGQVEDGTAIAAATRLADCAYRKLGCGLRVGDVRDMFAELIEASGELDDGRPIEDVPVGDVL